MSEQNKHQYIAIAGNIGAGKSSLTGLLAQHFGWKAFYESVDDNPYLADFYEDMLRWSFNLQIYFLSSRFRHQKDMLRKQISLIQDRTIYEDVEIFAKNLHQMDLMSDIALTRPTHTKVGPRRIPHIESSNHCSFQSIRRGVRPQQMPSPLRLLHR